MHQNQDLTRRLTTQDEQQPSDEEEWHEEAPLEHDEQGEQTEDHSHGIPPLLKLWGADVGTKMTKQEE